jgi:hypothetical protein
MFRDKEKTKQNEKPAENNKPSISTSLRGASKPKKKRELHKLYVFPSSSKCFRFKQYVSSKWDDRNIIFLSFSKGEISRARNSWQIIEDGHRVE